MENVERYVYKIYQEQSFSSAARALYLSQPALSASVAKLEKELGFRIFNRKTVPISLTAQGEIYIAYLEECLAAERLLQQKLRQFSNNSGETLTVGGSSYAAQQLLPLICGKLNDRYHAPRISIDLGNVGNIQMIEKLRKGMLDLLLSYNAPKEFKNTPIFREQMVIAMHENIVGAKAIKKFAVTRSELLDGSYPKEKELDDLSIFQDIPFLMYNKPSSTASIMKGLLGDYKTASCEIYNNRSSVLHYDAMCSGLGALLTTDTHVRTHIGQDGLLFFVPKHGQLSHRTLYILQSPSKSETSLEISFIEIAKEVCAEFRRSP